jgi:DNA polymerase III delta prime subunit
MSLSDAQVRQLEVVAEETLSTLTRIAKIAMANLQSGPSLSAGSLASVNTFTSTGTVQSLDRINSDFSDSNQQLLKEPAIARVVVANEAGTLQTYYICRATPPNGTELASYRSQVGRLASLPVGDVWQLPRGEVEVRERALLRPINEDGWDSRNSVVEGKHYGPITVESFRALIAKLGAPTIEVDLLEKLLAAETTAEILRSGVRRGVITKMGLRDQPVLDKYQDEIFRLPLNSQLLILGPPGTGKTTTLIRRLGLKLDVAYFSTEERSLIDRAVPNLTVPHQQSWVMFTPTDLLKHYVKEAFAREGIAASDQRIRTWADYRREVARNSLGILRTTTGSGSFVIKDNIENLLPTAVAHAIDWFVDFDEWNRSAFISEIRDAAKDLSDNHNAFVSQIGTEPIKLLNTLADQDIGSLIEQLSALSPATQAYLVDLKKSTDEKVRGALNLQVNISKTFLDELAAFVDSLKELPTTENEEVDEFETDEEDEEPVAAKTGHRAAAEAYMRAIRAQARMAAKKRTLSKGTRHGRICDWLGDRGLSTPMLLEVGSSLVVQSGVRKLVNPARRYVDRIPRRYREFRKRRTEDGNWYLSGSFIQTDIHPLELDLILLTTFRATRMLLQRRAVVAGIDQPEWVALKRIRDLFRNQILVDEVTDFSPIQIACMAALTDPATASFFACGDFNQRLTNWGSRSIKEIEWAYPGIVSKTISVSYRQSRQLNELAREIARVTGEGLGEALLPEHVDNEGLAPVLAEGLKSLNEVAAWLAERISEIEGLLNQLPSIAILVLGEEQVQPIADGLGLLLTEKNIQVVACHDGQAIGKDNDVRVFDVKHIKGLEFEAVFFVGIDQLAARQPELFGKYLYVGTTRAAVYLGVTNEGTLPPVIEPLRSLFIKTWA